MANYDNLSRSTQLVRIKAHSAAGTSAVTSDAIDLGSDWDSALVFTTFGTAAADNTIKVQTSSDDSTYNDLTGTSVASGSDGTVWVEIIRTQERYLKVVAARGTSSTLETIYAILHPKKSSGNLDPNVRTGYIGEVHVSPAEGTA